MLGLRFTTDCHPRTKKDHPPQSTTGVARTSSSHLRIDLGTRRQGSIHGMYPPMTMNTRGIVRTALTQRRRVMSMSSGLSSSSSETVLGSSAMPQMGQFPGASRTISGCMGQTHSVFAAGLEGSRSSSAIPHLGQETGSRSRISGCMGQLYDTLLFCFIFFFPYRI